MSIKYWFTHNRCRMITALVFCMVFTLLAFAPPFSTSAHAIAIADDAIFLILAAFLASSGILLTAQSSGNVTDFLRDAVNDFCADVGESWASIKSGFKFGVDKLGNILTDNSVLDFFSRFSDWMTRFYGLTDNSSAVVHDPLVPARLPVVDFVPTVAEIIAGNYIYAHYDDTPYYMVSSGPITIIDHVNGSVIMERTHIYTDPSTVLYSASPLDTSIGTAVLANFSPDTQNGYYIVTVSIVNQYLPSNNLHYSQTVDYENAIESILSVGSPLVMQAGTITIPVDGTNYTDEDGVVIGGVGTWGDSLNDILEKLREWLDEQSSTSVADPTLTVETESTITSDLETDLLSVDNWPGMIPPSAFPEFSFSSIWHYVTDWLAAFSGTLSLVLGISFALPAVSIVYAVIVLSLTLWLLRKVSS